MDARPRASRVRRLGALALLAVATATATGCGDDAADTRSETMGMPATFQELQHRGWVLDEAASTPRIDSPRRVTLHFTDGAVSSRGPCNALRGMLEIDEDSVEDDSIAITRLAGTQRTCGDAADRAEATYVEALEAATEVDVDRKDDRLELTGPDGVRLVFDGRRHLRGAP
jgi:heat shock protein HslJ